MEVWHMYTLYRNVLMKVQKNETQCVEIHGKITKFRRSVHILWKMAMFRGIPVYHGREILN